MAGHRDPATLGAVHAHAAARATQLEGALVAAALLGEGPAEAIEEPVAALLEVAGELRAATVAAKAAVGRLKGNVRYSSQAGEQLRAEVALWERLLATSARVLSDIAKLNLEERLVRIEEAKATRIIEAVSATLAVAGLTPEQRDAAILDLAARLRGPAKVIAAPAR